jgi:hypothetical protein
MPVLAETPVNLALVDDQPDGLFVFWRLRSVRPCIDLEAVFYFKPSESRPVWPAAGFYVSHERGQVLRFAARWMKGQYPPKLVEKAGGPRVWLIARDLGPHYPDHGLEGWLRIPDGDIPELEASWAKLADED